MESIKQVTLPTAAMLRDKPRPLTDYARVMGARSVYTTNMKSDDIVATGGDQNCNFGEVWLCTPGETTGEVQTATWRIITPATDAVGGTTKFATQVHSRVAVSPHVAVVPCFKVGAKGVGVGSVDGKLLLTINDKVVFYPQDLLDAMTSSRCEAAYSNLWFTADGEVYKTKDDQRMKLVGGYTRPVRYDYAQQKYQRPVDQCLEFEGKIYVRVRVSAEQVLWFSCDPVQVDKTECGKVLPKVALLAGAFDQLETYFAANYAGARGEELDISRYSLGKFLNNEFMDNLHNSTYFNASLLTHPKPQFATGLKNGMSLPEHAY